MADERAHETPLIKGLEAHVETLKEQLEKQTADFAERDAERTA